MPIIPIVLNFLRKNWLPILICVSVFSLYFYIGHLQSSIKDLELQVTKLEAEMIACVDNVESRNKVIEAWSEKTKKENEQMQNLRNDISKLTKNTNVTIQKILQKESPETCDDAIKYFIDMGQRYE